jgi:hypothetical protein
MASTQPFSGALFDPEIAWVVVLAEACNANPSATVPTNALVLVCILNPLP